MHWGNKILIVFIVFGGMISYMVYRCMNTPVDLVSSQYYKDELAYQQVIDGAREASALSSGVELALEGRTIRISLPPEMRNKAVGGTVFFYCPADAGRDRTVPLKMNSAGQQQIGEGVVPNGHYIVKVSWESAGIHYFMERPFVIQ